MGSWILKGNGKEGCFFFLLVLCEFNYLYGIFFKLINKRVKYMFLIYWMNFMWVVFNYLLCLDVCGDEMFFFWKLVWFYGFGGGWEIGVYRG